MRKRNQNQSIEKDGKESQIIIISKSRLSSAKENLNYMTIQEGELKVKLKIKYEPINRLNINKAIASVKNIMLKHSKSQARLIKKKENIKFLDDSISENQSKNKILKKMNNQPNIEYETTKSLKIKSSENNKEKLELENDDKEFEINTKPINVSEIHNNDINNEDNLINIDDRNILNRNSIESKNKFLSQNFFSKTVDKNLKIKTIKIIDSKEIKFFNTHMINEEEKKIGNNDKTKQSEKTTKSVVGSVIALKSKYETNYLQTENGFEEKSGNNSIKSNNDLIIDNKSKKKEEKKNEDEDYVDVVENDDSDEVEGEIDEKIKDDNIREINNAVYFMNNINNLTNLNNKEIQENIQKVKNEVDNTSQDRNDNKGINCIYLNQNNNNIYKMCYICEHTYNILRFFVAECNEHFICKKCAKIYYEDVIEDGVKDFFCPILNCKAPMITSKLKDIISQEHFKRLNYKCGDNSNHDKNNNNDDKVTNKFFFAKLRTNLNEEKMTLYTKKHVIDINSNKSFFDYNKGKDGYCPFCYEKSLFSKINAKFYKCLNCLRKICKYCFKEFKEGHIDIKDNQHCKVYYRIEENEKKILIILLFLRQLFMVFASFFLVFPGSFFYYKQLFFQLLNVKQNKYFFKYIIGYFSAIICFVISFPFIFLLFPYFPSIMALSDF